MDHPVHKCIYYTAIYFIICYIEIGKHRQRVYQRYFGKLYYIHIIMHHVSYAHVYLSHGVINATRTQYDSFNSKHFLLLLNFIKKNGVFLYVYDFNFVI